MNATISALAAAFGLVETFAPLVPEVISAVPTIVSDAQKAASDLKSLNISATIADIEGIVAAIPSDAVSKVVEASKSIKL